MAVISTLVYAFNTLTSDATIPTANDTVTIGGVVYTFKGTGTVTTVAGQVDLGLTAAAALTNLKAAINADPAGAGTLFGSATVANPYVTATTLTATTLKVVSKVPGRVGNFIPCLATSTHLDDWTAAVCASGSGDINTAITQILARLGKSMNSAVYQALLSIDAVSTAD